MRDIILPGPSLARHVRMLVLGRFEGGTIHLPATAEIQLLVYLRGGAAVQETDGSWTALPPAFVAGPSMRPTLYSVEPGSAYLGILFRPGGFQSRFGIPADGLAGHHLPLDLLLPRAVVARLLEMCHSAPDRAGLLATAAWLLGTGAMGRDATRRQLPALPLALLLQDSGQLSSLLGVGPRQLERRFLAAYGMPLRDYRRLARFSHSLTRLMAGASARGRLAGIALDAFYSDQAHFTREFRRFVGTSPGQFLAAREEDDSLYRLWQFDREELRAYAPDEP